VSIADRIDAGCYTSRQPTTNEENTVHTRQLTLRTLAQTTAQLLSSSHRQLSASLPNIDRAMASSLLGSSHSLFDQLPFFLFFVFIYERRPIDGCDQSLDWTDHRLSTMTNRTNESEKSIHMQFILIDQTHFIRLD
jgi:hypothetical protein